MKRKTMLACTLIWLVASILIAYFFCHINQSVEAGWFRGFWHGVNIVPNWILSFFDGRLLKAQFHSTMYSVFWWIFVVLSVWGWLLSIIKLILSLFNKEDEE